MSDDDSDTIHNAVRRCDLEAVRRFVEVEGLDVDCRRDGCGSSPLIVAASCTTQHVSRVLPLIRYLISKNANVEAATINRLTALMSAARLGNAELVKLLLEEGAKVDTVYQGYTALTYAAGSPKGFCVVPVLLQHGAKANPSGRNTPLLYACQQRNSAVVVKQLLGHGAEITSEAMHFAAEYSDAATVRLLIAHGGDVNASRTSESSTTTPLVTGIENGNVGVVKTLLEHNANVHVIFGHTNDSLLHIVPDAEICNILLKYCRTTLSEIEFGKFLLRPNTFTCQRIALRYACSAEIAKLLVEQPRRHNKQLPPTCHEQLVWESEHGNTERERSYYQEEKAVAYLETFESLALSVPGNAVACVASSTTSKRHEIANDEMAVKFNPALNDFQRSVAQEVFDLLIDTTGCPDSIAHGMLGYLSPLDVMKRNGCQAPSLEDRA